MTEIRQIFEDLGIKNIQEYAGKIGADIGDCCVLGYVSDVVGNQFFVAKGSFQINANSSTLNTNINVPEAKMSDMEYITAAIRFLGGSIMKR